MKFVLSALLISISLLACQKDANQSENQPIDGAYAGTFHRTGMDTSSMQLDLENGRFEGSSDQQRYPAICRGTYTMDGSSISFMDSCTWTADFDWTLILNGTYTIDNTNDQLRITRTVGTSTDEYLLRRITR